MTSLPQSEGMSEEAVEATAIEGAPAPTDDTPTAKLRGNDARREMIIHGPIQKGVLAVAIPSVATMLLQTTNSMLDRFFIGKLGPEALAAITVASSLMFALMAAAFAVSVGTTALVARFLGEKSGGTNPHATRDAETAGRQSLLLALGISLAVGLPVYLLRDSLLTALHMDAASKTLAFHYLGVSVLGLPSLFVMLILNGIFRGMGDTTRPLWVTLGANGVHAGFNYLLIFGNFGFPQMGLPGGALALAISQFVAVALYLVFLRRTSLAGVLRGDWVPRRDWAVRIARIGLPASAQQLLRVGSMLAFQGLLNANGAGSAAVAALGVGLVSESIAFMPGFGYSIAASAFVGQNLGARQVRRANTGAWAATWQAVAVMSVMGVVFYVCAEPFARLFVQHNKGESALAHAQVEDTIRLTISYLRTAAYSEPFLALGMVLNGALQGAGETVGPTALTIITMVLFRLPLAYFVLRLGYGTYGAWWAMSISTMLQGVLTVALFRRGRWRTIRV